MATIINNKCPACGAHLEQDTADSNFWVCPYCGLRQKLEKKPVEEAVENIANTIKDAVKSVATAFSDDEAKVEVEEKKEENHENDGKRDKYVALFLCFFFGYLGIHKFYENKIGLGLLYMFTGGLFYIGVILDFITLLFKTKRYYYVDGND